MYRLEIYTYELEHGTDLIHETVKELSTEMAKIMKINGQIQRMDSLMVESNIKTLSRMELLYTCLSDFVTYLHKNHEDGKLEGLEHYYDPADYNRVIYHQRSSGYAERLQEILNDADRLLSSCEGGYDDVTQYQLLVRVFSEQTVREAGSIVTDYQYEQNNHSDSEFLKEHLESAEKRPEQVTLVTDGAYSGEENRRLAKEKNMCENCPYKDQCQPKISNKTSRVYVTKAAHERALSQRFRKTWQFEFLSGVRNGVETVPSILRRRYHIDTMPVRGKIRTKHMFGFKIGALNFRKLLKYLSSREKCALNPETV